METPWRWLPCYRCASRKSRLRTRTCKFWYLSFVSPPDKQSGTISVPFPSVARKLCAEATSIPSAAPQTNNFSARLRKKRTAALLRKALQTPLPSTQPVPFVPVVVHQEFVTASDDERDFVAAQDYYNLCANPPALLPVAILNQLASSAKKKKLRLTTPSLTISLVLMGCVSTPTARNRLGTSILSGLHF